MSDGAGFLYGWERIVLAARLSPTTKLVAFAMRTFADPDGGSVRPGTARLQVLCNLSYPTVKRARQDLLRAGLVELVRRGNRRKGQADEYRLTLAQDVLDRLVWLSPSEIDAAVEKITEQRQAVEAARVRTRAQGAPTDAHEITPSIPPPPHVGGIEGVISENEGDAALPPSTVDNTVQGSQVHPEVQGSDTDPETVQGSQVAPNRGSGLTDKRDQGSLVTPHQPNRPTHTETNPVVGNGTSKRRRARVKPSALRPPCGQCDARPNDPPNARRVWLDFERSEPCPRCSPEAVSHVPR